MRASRLAIAVLGAAVGLLGAIPSAATAADVTCPAPNSLPAPAGCRAYELVTPADDLPYPILSAPWLGIGGALPRYINNGARRTTDDGRTHALYVQFNKGGLPGIAPDGDATELLVAGHVPSGWDWRAPWGDRTDCSLADSSRLVDLADDGESVLLGSICKSEHDLLSPRDPATGEVLDQTTNENVNVASGSLYRFDRDSREPEYLSGRYDASGRLTVRSGSAPTYYIGGSPDLRTVYFHTATPLVPGVDAAPNIESGYLYRHADGVTTLLSRKGASISGDPVPMNVTFRYPASFSKPNTVSRDGDFITLTAPGSSTAPALDAALVAEDTNHVADVYRIGKGPGEVAWASRPRNPTPQPAQERLFEGASADGEVIVLASDEALLASDDDTAKDIYAYRASNDSLERVSVADSSCSSSCDDNASDETPHGYSAALFSTLSDDGSHVFFLSGDVLADDDDDATLSLYVRDLEADTTTYIAPAGAGRTSTVDGIDAGTSNLVFPGLVDSENALRFGDRPITVSPDGRTAAFWLASDTSLPPARGGDDTDGFRDLYIWRADVGLRRVRQGLNASDNHAASVPSAGCWELHPAGYPFAQGPCPALTSDGGRMVIATQDALTAEDTDGGFRDLYVMDTRDGSVELISPPGGDQADVRYDDMSRSGDVIFFITRETLDASRDRDGGVNDIYASRVGGGFGPLPDPPAECAGERCQSPAGADGGAQTETGQSGGPGDNERPRGRPTGSLRQPTRAQLRRLSRSGRIVLTARLTNADRVGLVAKARIGGRTRVVGRASRRSNGGGEVKLTLRLSRAARSTLANRRPLRVAISMRLAGAPGVKTIHVRLRPTATT